MEIKNINDKLLDLSETFEKIDTAISEMYATDIGTYAAIPNLISLDNEKSYRIIGRAFNFVIGQHNDLIARHLFIDEMGETAKKINQVRLNDSLVQSVDRIVQVKLTELEKSLSFVCNALQLMGIELPKNVRQNQTFNEK